MGFSIAVFIHNYSTSGVAYSGGRYHGLLLAYALAHAGSRVLIVVNSYPASARDLPSQGKQSLEYIVTENFTPSDVLGHFDFVVIAPTGGFYPEFYSCAEQVAYRCKSPVMLMNFESANWFNRLAPHADYPEVWDYWRRTILFGGIVLSSTRESDRHARDFYRSEEGVVIFDHCYPPINSVVADEVNREKKDGSLIYFARPFHPHKGGDDILGLPAQVFSDRVLRVVFGGDVDLAYCEMLKSRIALASRASLEVYSKVDDLTKFRLISMAGALLFPSRFEGFGYPPVEAAYMGTESVCYELPVLVETVGSVAHFAPVGDTEALGARLIEALRYPPRRSLLRSAIANKVTIESVSAKLLGILEKAYGRTRTADGLRRYTVLWGPWKSQDLGEPVGTLDFPPTPCWARVIEGELHADFVMLTVFLWARGEIVRSALEGHNVRSTGSIRYGDAQEGWRRHKLDFSLPLHALNERIYLRSTFHNGDPAHRPQSLSIQYSWK